MTGLYNRKFGSAKFDELITAAEKSNKSFGVIFIDLDRLMVFNDLYTHPEGDNLICRIADKLKETVSENGFVARYGGDEYLILLPDFSKDSTQNLAEELRAEIENISVEIDGKIFNPMTATLGVAIYPFQGKDMISLLRNADEALCTGKGKGKNCVVISENNGSF